MKTPKRHYHIPPERQALDIEPDSFDEDYYLQEARWNRKNRIRVLKHTIAVLNRKLRDTERCLAHTYLSPQKVLVMPDHWHDRFAQILKELNKP